MQNRTHQNNSTSHFRSPSGKGSGLLAARAFCVYNPLGIHSIQPGGIGLVVDAPKDQHGQPYENHVSSAPVRECSPLSDFDILFVKSFLEANPINLSAHAKDLGMGSADVDRIIRGLE
jgi:hypothetical protein